MMTTKDDLFEPSRPRPSHFKKDSTWRSSKAKKLLQQLLADGTIPLSGREMGSREVYDYHPEFSVFPYEPFPGRLSKLRSDARTKSNEGKSDLAALIQDRAQYPCPTHNAAGVLRWEGSEAEAMLKLDVSNHLHEQMTPMELYYSRAMYQLYKLEKFRGHIHQEIKRRKFIRHYYGNRV